MAGQRLPTLPRIEDVVTSLAARSITVMGLGAIGRFIALQLAMLGARRLHLVDTRAVAVRWAQIDGYGRIDGGRPRAHAAAQACHEICPEICVQTAIAMPIVASHLGRTVMLAGGPWFEPLRPGKRRAGEDGFVIVQVVASGNAIDVRRLDGRSSPAGLARKLTQWWSRARRRQRVVAPHAAAIAAGLAVRELLLPMRGGAGRNRARLDLASLEGSIE